MSRREIEEKVLPEGWREVRLNDVASIKTGPFGAQLHQHDYVKCNGTPIVTVEHLGERGLTHNNLPLVSNHDKKRLSKYLIQEGDIVFSRVGSVDRSALVSKEESGWLFSGRLLRVSPNKHYVHSPYLNYFFHTRKFRHHMRSIAVGGTMPSINTSILSGVTIFLPSMEAQKGIASLLETWDTAIEKTEALIAAKEKRFKWLLSTLISNQQGKPEWRTVQMADILTESREPDTTSDPIKRLTVRLHLKGVCIRDYRGTESENATYYFKRKAGQLIYGKQNIFKGAIGIIPDNLDGYSSSQDIPAFDVSSNVSAKWLLLYFSRFSFYKSLEHLAAGSGSKRLHPKDLYKVVIRLPPMLQQKQTVHMFDTTQKEIYFLKQLVVQYRKQKRGLMQKLLTGKWKVK